MKNKISEEQKLEKEKIKKPVNKKVVKILSFSLGAVATMGGYRGRYIYR